ncbi:hypothetical protein [Enterococcus sp. DIV0806c]|uniref:hypothetical protein n=1 Tax=unclassified Enterococcus TaxID=2608891 RepID=UPI003F1E996F
MRKKIFSRECLLEGAYHFVVQEGFDNFKARKLADFITCSTQPIYREFQNIAEFRQSTYEYIISIFDSFIAEFKFENTRELVDIICHYASSYPREFQRFFLQDTVCTYLLKERTYDYFISLVKLDNHTEYKTFWNYTLGKASLCACQKVTIFTKDTKTQTIDHLFISVTKKDQDY